jgi:hypothetical protein
LTESVTRWGWSRPFGTVYAVEVRPTCDGRGWFEMRCPDGCCVTRYLRSELYESEGEATRVARAWVQGKVASYTTALAALTTDHQAAEAPDRREGVT